MTDLEDAVSEEFVFQAADVSLLHTTDHVTHILHVTQRHRP